MIVTSSGALAAELQCVRFRGIDRIVRLDAEPSGPRLFHHSSRRLRRDGEYSTRANEALSDANRPRAIKPRGGAREAGAESLLGLPGSYDAAIAVPLPFGTFHPTFAKVTP